MKYELSRGRKLRTEIAFAAGAGEPEAAGEDAEGAELAGEPFFVMGWPLARARASSEAFRAARRSRVGRRSRPERVKTEAIAWRIFEF